MRQAMELHPSNWPAEFICPISMSVMADPVIVSSGQTYERRCIEAWMDLGQQWCVRQNMPLDCNLIIPNAGLKAAIRNMAKSKGMLTLPLPPSPEHAYALARQLLQELSHTDSWAQEPCSLESKSEDSAGYDDEETHEHSGPIRVHNMENEEEREETELEDLEYARFRSLMGPKRADNSQTEGAHDRKESPRIVESKSSHLEDDRVEASENAHDHIEGSDLRKGIHLKSSSSLPPTDKPTEGLGERRRNFIRESSYMQAAPASQHKESYATAANDLEKGFDRFRSASEHHRGGYSLTNPVRNSRFASGEAPLDAMHDARELPPHLVTKPSSYSSSEPLHASSSPSCSADPLVRQLRSRKQEEQEVAVTELRQLSRKAENRTSLCRTDIVEALLPLFQSKNMNVQVNAVAALVNLSIEKLNKVVIVRAGAVRFLVEVLYNGFPEAQEHAVGAAFSLAIADENKHPMGVLNTIPPLIQFLHSGPDGAREDAALALYHLSLLQTNKSKLVKEGAVPILLNLAQSKEKPHLASRALIILANAASIPEGRAALLKLNAIPVLVGLLAIEGGRSSAMIPEQAAAVLVLLSKNNLRFKLVAESAGARELLAVMVEKGTTRGREKALTLSAIMKESSAGPDESDGESVLSRQYMRMRVDEGQMNSSAF